jgi:phospholipase/lecithinase/hemolysin
VNGLARLLVLVLLSGPVVLPASGAFSTIYVFGDGVSTTTNNPYGGPGSHYYGYRHANGRVWVEVLAQRQGLESTSTTNVNWSYSTNNLSYLGHDSSHLVQNVNSFVARPEASTALFVVWVNNADYVLTMNTYGPNNAAEWTSATTQSLTNHWAALTNLYYAKGARTFIMPNAVDITEIPAYGYVAEPGKSAVRQHIKDFNTAFAALLNQARASLPDARIYAPDIFSLLDDFLAHPATYGVTNALDDEGHSVDALGSTLTDLSLTGPGANYIYWDEMCPTAKAQAVLADVVQQLMSPVKLGAPTVLSGSNRLDVVNAPIGLPGSVEGRTNLGATNWPVLANFTLTNMAQPVFVPASGPLQFYRLHFPFSWSWP